MKAKIDLGTSEKIETFRNLIANFIFINNKWNSVLSLIQNFDYEKYHFKKNKQNRSMKNLVENFKISELYKEANKYDLFRVLNYIPSENNISDVIASIINPKVSPYGKKIINKIIEEGQYITKNNCKLSNLSLLVNKTPIERFYVKREWSGDLSRIDIRITTRNPYFEDNILIDIEMKVGSGSETYSNKMYQTEREWLDLENWGKKLQIPKKNVVAFYISPLGYNPNSEYFIPISGYKLNDFILEILKNTHNQENNFFSEECIWALRHFFSSTWIF